MPLGIWLAGVGGSYIADGSLQVTLWGLITIDTSFAISMVVNALVTGLIVYKIFKAFRKIQQGSTSVEKSLGVNNGGRKYRSLIFIIIESGITLFAIQLVRFMLSLPPFSNFNSTPITVAVNFIIAIHEMLNVIMTLVIVNLYFADNVDLARV